MKKSLIVILVSVLFLVSGCYQQQTQTSDSSIPNTITIDSFAFNPQELTINVNTEVSWTNNQDISHTVISQGLFESPVLKKGDTFKFKFTEAGTYDYHCSIHPSMKGKVIVNA